MLLPAILLPFLASAAAATAPSAPITVTGHAWAPFISPMGEPFRAHSPTDDTLADWFAQADRNHDAVLTVDEMVADAARFYALLDADHNGEIDPDEIANYEWEVAPDIQIMSKTRRAPGGASAPPSHSDDCGRFRASEGAIARGLALIPSRRQRRASGGRALRPAQHPRTGGGGGQRFQSRDIAI